MVIFKFHGIVFKRLLLLNGFEIKRENWTPSKRNSTKPTIDLFGAGIIDFEMLHNNGI